MLVHRFPNFISFPMRSTMANLSSSSPVIQHRLGLPVPEPMSLLIRGLVALISLRLASLPSHHVQVVGAARAVACVHRQPRARPLLAPTTAALQARRAAAAASWSAGRAPPLPARCSLHGQNVNTWWRKKTKVEDDDNYSFAIKL